MRGGAGRYSDGDSNLDGMETADRSGDSNCKFALCYKLLPPLERREGDSMDKS
jgi:hypothetical protein